MIINNQLINPKSICIVGGSSNTKKPGGKIIENLINGSFKGRLYIVNPHETEVQGLTCFPSEHDVPAVELAIIVIPAHLCVSSIKILASEKDCHAFIIISAGFSESGPIGIQLKNKLLEILEKTHSCLLGPNCIGLLNAHYQGVFTSPIPKIAQRGCDLASSSGATAVFIMESSIPKGITFSSLISMGNSAQIGIEEVLEYWDMTYDPDLSSPIKLLYLETVRKPQKLLFHATSLIRKGAKIAAIKAGASRAGIRAASSHTGALATPDQSVDALFKKAGIIRCAGREELTNVAAILTNKLLTGNRIAIITHAGGPAVMLADVLSDNGFEIPPPEKNKIKQLQAKLFSGASAGNPIDILATGTAEQLAFVIDYCEKEFESIDAMVVIFGSPGLEKVYDAYEVIHEKMKSFTKPIFPILPSLQTAKEEIHAFVEKSHTFFPDEILFGQALARVFFTAPPGSEDAMIKVDLPMTKKVIKRLPTGYIPMADLKIILNEIGFPHVPITVVKDGKMLLSVVAGMDYPLVLKATGLVHKTEMKGVSLNITSEKLLLKEFNRLIAIDGVNGILVQPMIQGLELYIGARYEADFGHFIYCGLGGVFVEVIKDISVGLAPLSFREAIQMIKNLKSYKVLEGARGKKGIDIEEFAKTIVKTSALCCHIKEIQELDLNPLIANEEGIFTVDARILLRK